MALSVGSVKDAVNTFKHKGRLPDVKEEIKKTPKEMNPHLLDRVEAWLPGQLDAQISCGVEMDESGSYVVAKKNRMTNLSDCISNDIIPNQENIMHIS